MFPLNVLAVYPLMINFKFPGLYILSNIMNRVRLLRLDGSSALDAPLDLCRSRGQSLKAIPVTLIYVGAIWGVRLLAPYLNPPLGINKSPYKAFLGYMYVLTLLHHPGIYTGKPQSNCIYLQRGYIAPRKICAVETQRWW